MLLAFLRRLHRLLLLEPNGLSHFCKLKRITAWFYKPLNVTSSSIFTLTLQFFSLVPPGQGRSFMMFETRLYSRSSTDDILLQEFFTTPVPATEKKRSSNGATAGRATTQQVFSNRENIGQQCTKGLSSTPVSPRLPAQHPKTLHRRFCHYAKSGWTSKSNSPPNLAFNRTSKQT